MLNANRSLRLSPEFSFIYGQYRNSVIANVKILKYDYSIYKIIDFQHSAIP